MSKFKIGQKVWCLLNGEGTVVSTNYGKSYPICVKFGDRMEDTYTEDGKMGLGHVTRCLYFSKPVVTGDTEPPFVPTLSHGDIVVASSKLDCSFEVIKVEHETVESVVSKKLCLQATYLKSHFTFYKIGEKIDFN